jgi:phosphoenolpyruvate carboxykinase (ATP)
LDPKNTWEDKAAYDNTAKSTAKKFVENFKKYEAYVTEDVIKSGPKA